MLRKIGKSARYILKHVNPLNLFENNFIKKRNKSTLPPIFIIGAPRSGTTLLYQLITYHYDSAFFSNLSSVFIKSPVLISYLTKSFFKPYNDRDLSSKYGLMKGIWAPSEAGKIFQYWFQKKNDEVIKNSIAKQSSIYGAPFIGKNLRINSQLEYILKLFPNAKFVYIKRDILFNAQSLIVGILENKTDIIGNITLDEQRNKISSGSKRTVFNQVVQDINNMNTSIETFLNRPEVDSISIKYSDLCDNYEHELKRLELVYSNENHQLQRKSADFNLSISESRKQNLPDEDWDLLNEIIKQ